MSEEKVVLEGTYVPPEKDPNFRDAEYTRAEFEGMLKKGVLGAINEVYASGPPEPLWKEADRQAFFNPQYQEPDPCIPPPEPKKLEP